MKKLIVPICLLAFLFVSCAGVQTQQLTGKQQAAIWFSLYNSQYDDTMSIMTSPISIPAMKEMALKKKEVLTQVWPLLRLYSSLVEGGATPTVDVTNQIITLMNLLVAGGTK